LDEDGYYDMWTKFVFAEPTIDGIVVDEFGWGKITDYPVWEKVVKRFRKDERFKGKTFRGYVTAAVSYNDTKKRLVRTINELGYKVAFERYEEERPTQREGWRFLDSELTEQMLCWERTFPGCMKKCTAT